MSEYPEDILETARNVARDVGAIWEIDPIAKAILAERERCKGLLAERSRDVRRGHVERACYANAVALISRGDQ